MYYKSLADLGRAVAEASSLVPGDVDLVVGVPRSGLLAANLLALHLGLRLADFDGFLEGRVLSNGRRTITGGDRPVRHALVLDDSISTGAQMEAIHRRLAARELGCKVTTAAVFVAPERVEMVDIVFEVLGNPRAFEWNLMNNYLLPSACVDIDGVLCIDPTEEENDDGPRYEQFLASATRLHRPAVKVGWLVTSRLEKYRAATERWLASHGVEYGELIMLDLPSKAARQEARAHGSFKAKVYSRTPSSLFIESDEGQAREIASRSGKPVLCVGSHRMYYPSVAQMSVAKVARAPWSVTGKARRLGSEALRHLLMLPRYPGPS